MLGELRYTSRSFYKVEVKILGGGYFNPSLCNLLHLAKWENNLLNMAVLRLSCGHLLQCLVTYNSLYSW
jgi:hypothetical protein